MNLEGQGMTMTKALDILLYKARNTKLAYRRYQLLLRENEKKMQPAVKEFMDYLTKKLRAKGTNLKGINVNEIHEKGEEILEPALYEILTSGADSVKEREMRKQERFDPIGQEAINWTTKHSASLVVEITDDTMLAIREFVKAGVNAGMSMPAIATQLRPVVGLHSQYANAVGTFHTKLLADGVAASQAAAKASTYAGRLHRRRTMTIARTETAFALSEGQRQGYGQMGIKHLERIEDPECCDICAEYNGNVYSVKEAEGVLPEHPNCEGTWVAATGEQIAQPTTAPTRGGAPSGVATEAQLQKVADSTMEALADAGTRSKIIMDGITRQSALEIEKSLIRMNKKYKSDFRFFSTRGRQIPANTMGMCVDQQSIYLKKNYLNSAKISKETVKKTNKSGFHPKIPEAMFQDSITTHEFAHSIVNVEKAIRAETEFGRKFKKLWDGYVAEQEALVEAYQKSGKLPAMKKYWRWQETKRVSIYADDNASEFLAECIVDAEMGVKPSPWSKKVQTLVKEYFGTGG